jgi:pimeloyl-ACP methyl ester carboxylesterase
MQRAKPAAPKRVATCRIGWVAIVASLLAAGCGAPRDAPQRTLALADCRLPKLALAAQCGELTVLENRAAPGGRTIKLTVAVLPANTLHPRPDPLFILAGGPGQAATSLGPFAAQLTDVRKDRDIVLVDQRGTGRSSPLDCPAFAADDALATALDLDPVPKAKACLAELAARGADPTQYTTAAFVADLDEMRRALGYGAINLWGGSYGTRAALEYLRRYPKQVRAAVLDSVAPPSMRILLDVWPSRDAALDAVFSACTASPACVKAHPDLAADFAKLREQLGRDGRDVTFVDPRTGETQTARITYDYVLAALQPILYLPELQSLAPEAIGRAVAGDFAPLQALATFVTADFARQTTTALHYAVTCSEDAPRIAPDEVARMPESLRTKSLAEHVLAVCAVWPSAAVPSDATTPVTSDIPVLLLSGGLDPVTPPGNAAAAAATLPHSKQLVAVGYGHIVSSHACGPRLIAAFLDDPSFATLPPSCVAHFEASARPPLWPDRLGAQP